MLWLHLFKSVFKTRGTPGRCCPTVCLIFLRNHCSKFRWRSSVSFNVHLCLWTCFLLVLVVDVDGALAQQPLSCLQLSNEPLVRDNQSQDIFWKKNGIQEAQTGNWYSVRLVESLGGGNYTCHSKNGSLLNHTEVLIRQRETTRRRILVNSDQGMTVKHHCVNLNNKTEHILNHLTTKPLALWLCSLDDYLKCSTQNYDGEFHCSWTWHSSRVGKVAFVKVGR